VTTSIGKAATRGDTWQLTLRRYDSTGAQLNLSGYTIEASAMLPGARTRFTLDVDRTDDATGITVIKATRAQTAQWIEQQIVCDVRYTSPDGRDERTPKLVVPVTEGVVT